MASLKAGEPTARKQSAVLWEHDSEEVRRLVEDKQRKKNWKRWGPYLSERQWGTVREDYSADGSCWDYLPHDHARSRAYRWGEDGLLGITDRECRLCFALALWNEKDPILKERLFGLTGTEGNHGEDVKECYYYLDSTPTHSYMKALYKYPQKEFPYSDLLHVNRQRGKRDSEFELSDTGTVRTAPAAFNDSSYWDITAEYAKNTPNDILVNITVANRGAALARLHLLPTLWFRNTWIWGCKHEGCTMKALIKETSAATVQCKHETLGKFTFTADIGQDGKLPSLLFTENETNSERLFNFPTYTNYTKDAFHRYLIHGEKDAVSPNKRGTKVAAHYLLEVPPGGQHTIRCRLSSLEETVKFPFDKQFSVLVAKRRNECDDFYKAVIPATLSAEEQSISRQAYAGLLWSKQFYHYIVKDWLDGDPEMPTPPSSRLVGRNAMDWKHLFNRDIVSMPDKWEYPWYASWDLAFHMLSFVKIDPEFAKQQLMLFLREWYMAPNGQIPAYEFALSDVNPPVHAWACIRVYKMSATKGKRDQEFLARCFQKLLLNFTWWVNRKDPDGKNIFGGGFLGLDNIGIFDRSKPLPIDGRLAQADGTAWMAFYCVVMLNIALDLAVQDHSYEDMASKFFEHFTHIADAMNEMSDGLRLWDEEDGFYYDHIQHSSGYACPLRVRSLVGLVPLLACLVLDDEYMNVLPGFRKRLNWFMENRKDLASQVTFMDKGSEKKYHHLLAIPTKDQLRRMLSYMLDENEFLSPYGIRSVSKYHKDHPLVVHLNGQEHRVDYVPGESNTYMFGGNSNWRGPVWFPLNFCFVEALERYDYFYGDSFKVECPTGSGNLMRLREVSQELSRRLVKLFLPDENGRRPCHGNEAQYATNPHWRELVLFYEYFDPDTGRGCGASHQTGWTALVTRCLDKCASSG